MRELKSILIIDDTEDDRIIARKYISRVIGQVTIFDSKDGQEGIDFLRDYSGNKEKFSNAFPPDLILLDINMPVMNGFQFLEDFSKLTEDHPDLKSTIISMFTSSRNKDDINQSFSFDFVKDYIIKPITRDKLKDLVDKFFKI